MTGFYANTILTTILGNRIGLGPNDELILKSGIVKSASGDPVILEGGLAESGGYTINVKAKGAKGDGIADDTDAFLAAIAAVEEVGGGVVDIPAGHYNVKGLFIPPSNTKFRGAGMDVTFLNWDDGDHCFVNDEAKECVEFSDFTIVGQWNSNKTQGTKFPFLLNYIDDVKFIRIGVDYSRSMSIAVRSCERASAEHCRIRWSAVDGISFVDVANYNISNNYCRWVGDNAIACHCTDAMVGMDGKVRSNGIISDNNLVQTCGINALGGKLLEVTGNTLTLCLGYGISVSYVGTEGNTPPLGVNVSNNTIADVITASTFGSNNYIQMSAVTGLGTGADSVAAAPGQADTVTGTVIDPYPYFYANSTDEPQAGSYLTAINNNHLIRTLPTVSKYSDWGYGELFTRSGWIDPAINAAALISTARGVNLGEGAGVSLMKNMLIKGNIMHGLSSGVFFQADTRYDNILIEGNEFLDMVIGGVVCPSGLTGNHNVTVRGNIFDLDPYLKSANRHASTDGAWQNNDQPGAFYNNNAGGFKFNDNEVRNAASIQYVPGAVFMRGNIAHCDPSAIGYNAANLGIGKPLASGPAITYVIEYSDPNDAQFGRLKSNCVLSASAMPNSGKYVAGHFVDNSSKSVAGGKVLMG